MASKKEEIPEMKIEGDVFFVVDTEESKWIYRTAEDAIERMKEVAKGEKVDLEKTAIWVVDTRAGEEGERGKWEIKQVPWSRIAQQLLRGE